MTPSMTHSPLVPQNELQLRDFVVACQPTVSRDAFKSIFDGMGSGGYWSGFTRSNVSLVTATEFYEAYLKPVKDPVVVRAITQALSSDFKTGVMAVCLC